MHPLWMYAMVYLNALMQVTSPTVQVSLKAFTTPWRTCILSSWNISDCKYFSCDGGAKCLPNEFVCDGITHCIDMADETNCSITLSALFADPQIMLSEFCDW